MQPMTRMFCVLLGVVAGIVPATASAHEFWLEPEIYTVETGGLVRVRAMHGERFDGAVVPRDEAMIERFEMRGSGSATSIVRGRHGSALSFARPRTTGIGCLVFESAEFRQVMPAAAFEAYLAEEGLDAIREQRAALGESNRAGREVYVRCAKALVTAGPEVNVEALHDVATGLPLEIVIERTEPIAGGPTITARVVFGETPIAGLRVVAVGRSAPDRLVELRTDAAGRVRFTPDAAGPWMLTALHMVRLDDRTDAEWKSFWSSTTFTVDAR